MEINSIDDLKSLIKGFNGQVESFDNQVLGGNTGQIKIKSGNGSQSINISDSSGVNIGKITHDGSSSGSFSFNSNPKLDELKEIKKSSGLKAFLQECKDLKDALKSTPIAQMGTKLQEVRTHVAQWGSVFENYKSSVKAKGLLSVALVACVAIGGTILNRLSSSKSEA